MIKMKNVIKKIASIALAFTLLGTGTAVIQTISPKSDNTIVASARGNYKPCQFHDGMKQDKGFGYVTRINNANVDDNGIRTCKICGKVTGKDIYKTYSVKFYSLGFGGPKDHFKITYKDGKKPVTYVEGFIDGYGDTYIYKKNGDVESYNINAAINLKINDAIDVKNRKNGEYKVFYYTDWYN